MNLKYNIKVINIIMIIFYTQLYNEIMNQTWIYYNCGLYLNIMNLNFIEINNI